MNSPQKPKISKKTSASHPTVLSFSRDQIERGNFSPLLWFLSSTTCGADVWSLKSSVSFCFHGYQNDPRELWQIPEVRSYLQQMLSMWTEWMFFVSLSDESLLTSVLSITNAELVNDSSQVKLGQDATETVGRAMDGIQAVFNDYGFPQKSKKSIEVAVLQYLSDKLTPRIFDGNHRPMSGDASNYSGANERHQI